MSSRIPGSLTVTAGLVLLIAGCYGVDAPVNGHTVRGGVASLDCNGGGTYLTSDQCATIEYAIETLSHSSDKQCQNAASDLMDMWNSGDISDGHEDPLGMRDTWGWVDFTIVGSDTIPDNPIWIDGGDMGDLGNLIDTLAHEMYHEWGYDPTDTGAAESFGDNCAASIE